MCYTGKGRFEDGFGSCKVNGFDKFERELNIEACIVCMGYPFNLKEVPEDRLKDFYTEEELKGLSGKARDLELVY